MNSTKCLPDEIPRQCTAAPSVATVHQLTLPVSLVQESQQKNKCFPQNCHLNTSCQSTFMISHFSWGCRRIRWVLLPSLAAGEDMGKGSGDPVPMNHERTVSSGEKLILFFHGFSNTTLMWNHAGETFAGQQEHFRGCRAGLLEPPELLIHVACGTVCST